MGAMTYFMTQIILKQGTRGDHGFMREVGVVGEGLKECLELEVRSERVRWPLCGELLQFASDGFGGHWESRHAWEDQRSFKLMQNGAWSCPGFAWDNPTDHFGTYLPSFNFPRTATIRRKKSSWVNARPSLGKFYTLAFIGDTAGVGLLVLEDRGLTSPAEQIQGANGIPEPASLGDICIGSAFDISSFLRWARYRPDHRDSGIRLATFTSMCCTLISHHPSLFATCTWSPHQTRGVNKLLFFASTRITSAVPPDPPLGGSRPRRPDRAQEIITTTATVLVIPP